MLRRSELAALARSKTDQQGAGAAVGLASVSASGIPIAAIARRHQAWLQAQGVGPGEAWFVRPGRGGQAWRRWRREEFAERLRAMISALQGQGWAQEIELQDIGSHSLRRGGATAAANAGVSVDDIKAHGRWRSDAVEVYIRRSAERRLRVVASM